jgi:hypothetical protein
MSRRLLPCILVSLLCSCATNSVPEIPEQLGPPVSITLNTLSPGALGPEDDHVALAAYQDGDGEWMAMTRAGGVYTATVRHRSYGIAFTCVDTIFPGITITIARVYYRSTSDDLVISDYSCAGRREYTTIEGMTVGVRAGEYATVMVSPDRASTVFSNSFSLSVPVQPASIWGTIRQNDERGPVRRVLRGPDFLVPPSAPVLFDFSAAQDPIFQAIEFPITYRSSFTSNTEIRSASGPSLSLPGTATQYISVPRDLMRRGEFFCVNSLERDYSGLISKTDYSCISEPIPFRADMAKDMNNIVPLNSPTDGTRLPKFLIPKEFSNFPIREYKFTLNALDIDIVITASGRWADKVDSRYLFPDLSTLSGYPPTLDFPRGLQIGWTATRIEKNTANFEPGHTTKTATAVGALTVE